MSTLRPALQKGISPLIDLWVRGAIVWVDSVRATWVGAAGDGFFEVTREQDDERLEQKDYHDKIQRQFIRQARLMAQV